MSRSTLSLLNLAEQIRRVHSVAMQVRHSRRTVVCGTVVCSTVGGTRDVLSSTGPTMKKDMVGCWMIFGTCSDPGIFFFCCCFIF